MIMRHLPSDSAILALLIVFTIISDGTIQLVSCDTEIKFYVQQQFGVNELVNVQAARSPATGTSTGFGLQVVYEYPITATNPTNTTAPVIGYVRGTSVVVNNTVGSSTFVVRNVVHYGDDGSTWVQEGEANFTSGAWELAIVGGTGKYRRAYGYSVARTVSFTRPSSSSLGPLIVTSYTARLSFR